MRETEVDRDAAALFLGQAIGVDSGERAYESGLAVVDVSRSADEKPFHAIKAIATVKRML
jgi:hypothetical protein